MDRQARLDVRLTGPCAISPTAALRMGIINGRKLRAPPKFGFPLRVESRLQKSQLLHPSREWPETSLGFKGKDGSGRPRAIVP
jgi:hypothetical protein